MSGAPERLTAWRYATELFHRVYTSHTGPEPDAFAAACTAVEPLIPAVKEEGGGIGLGLASAKPTLDQGGRAGLA
jgi:hypothetical protein